jgi:predicted esterase
MVTPHAKTLPIFWGHGKIDPLVYHKLAIASVEFLQNDLNIPVVRESGSAPFSEALQKGVVLRSYDELGHSAAPEELNDWKKWLKSVIP